MATAKEVFQFLGKMNVIRYPEDVLVPNCDLVDTQAKIEKETRESRTEAKIEKETRDNRTADDNNILTECNTEKYKENADEPMSNKVEKENPSGDETAEMNKEKKEQSEINESEEEFENEPMSDDDDADTDWELADSNMYTESNSKDEKVEYVSDSESESEKRIESPCFPALAECATEDNNILTECNTEKYKDNSDEPMSNEVEKENPSGDETAEITKGKKKQSEISESEEEFENESMSDDNDADEDWEPADSDMCTGLKHEDVEHVSDSGSVLDKIIESPSVPALAECAPCKSKEKYKKPSRLCVFCEKDCGEKLSRHILNKHKHEDRVKVILQLPKKEKDAALAELKKEGILLFNRAQVEMESPAYRRERKSKDTSGDMTICGLCKGFFSKAYFRRHKQLCQGDTLATACSVPVSLLSSEVHVESVVSEFTKEILSKFQDGPIGSLCKTDEVILNIGRRMYMKEKAKQDKKTQVKKTVMSDMRRLASLYAIFQKQYELQGREPLANGNAGDMFQREHFTVLSEAISVYCTRENGKLKAGLKKDLYYLIKKACRVTKGTHLVEGKDERASEIDKFVAVLQLHHDFLFGDATYVINVNRQTNLRKPTELPIEEDVQKLRNYTLQQLEDMLSDKFILWDSHNFKKLRDLVVSRLTLFNARRGGEPSRLMLKDWHDAKEGVWLDKQRIAASDDLLQKNMLDSLKITYQTGKGNNHLVPVLFPKDTVEAMNILCGPERETAGIPRHNLYVFASTQNSSSHVSGWHAMNDISISAGLDKNSQLNATKNRHRISTMYAAMDLPESKRLLFFKHMGHSEGINTHIYQTPLAIQEVTQVGSILQQIDAGPAHELPLHHPAGDAEADSVPGAQHPLCSLAAGESGQGEQPAPGLPGGSAGTRAPKRRHRHPGSPDQSLSTGLVSDQSGMMRLRKRGIRRRAGRGGAQPPPVPPSPPPHGAARQGAGGGSGGLGGGQEGGGAPRQDGVGGHPQRLGHQQKGSPDQSLATGLVSDQSGMVRLGKRGIRRRAGRGGAQPPPVPPSPPPHGAARQGAGGGGGELGGGQEGGGVPRQDGVGGHPQRLDHQQKARNYTMWWTKDEMKVLKHFKEIISGTSGRRVPGRADIQRFLAETGLNYTWESVRNKVVNERAKRLQLVKKRAESFT